MPAKRKNSTAFKKINRNGRYKAAVSLLLVTLLLMTLTVPASAAFPGIGTPGDDELVGEVYDFESYPEEAAYSDPGGDDILTNVVFKNTGSFVKTLIKDSGSYTVNGTLTISNIIMLCGDMRLSGSGVLSLDRLITGSSITLTAIDGQLPRVVASGARFEDLRQEKIVCAADGVALRYINGTIIAYPDDEKVFVFFNANRATTPPVPAQIEVTLGESVGTLPYPPQRTGYYFDGWNTSVDGSGSGFDGTTVVNSSITVYARWIPQAAPVFSENPKDRNLTLGENALFSVKVTGFPQPELRWEKNIEDDIWETVNGADGNILTIENVTASDAGFYRCVAVNEAAPEGVPSAAARLTVNSAAAPSLSCSVDFIDFGDVLCGNEKVISIDITGLNLETAITFSWSTALSEFKEINPASWDAFSGGRVNVVFKPETASDFSTSLLITSGSIVLSIDVIGTGITEDTPAIYLSPGVLDFGEIMAGTASYPRTVTVSAANLTGTVDYSLSGGPQGIFSVSAASGLSAVTGGTLTVYFTPPDEGYFYDELTVSVGTVSRKVILKGFGIAEPAAPELTVSHYAANFGNVYTIASESSKVDITVFGASLASNITASLSGGDAGQFSIAKKSGWSDTKGGVVEVTFKPTSTGAKEALLRISAVGFGIVPKDIMLTGIGIAATVPSFTAHPQTQTKAEGDNVTFSALAAGAPNPTYQWQYSTDAGTSWNDMAGENSSSLSISSVSRTMDGYRYRCVASNIASPAGVASQAATLIVTYPKITANPPEVGFGTAAVGGEKSLTLTITGVWLDGSIGYSKTGTDAAAFTITKPVSWSDVTGGSLIIKFSPSEIKSYSAQITFSGGGADEVTVGLTGTGIIVPPSFIVQPKDRTVTAGGTAEFSVELAEGTASYTLKWQKRADSSANWSDMTGQTGKKLTLSSVALSDNGTQYRCVAVYSDGEISSGVATLKVETDHNITEATDRITASGKTAVFKINGEVEKVTGLKIDAKATTLDGKGSATVKVKLDNKEIGTLTKGSVVLTLNAEFVDSLSNGVHNFEMEFDDGGIVRGSFTIARGTSGSGTGTGTGAGSGTYGPYTGDRTGFVFWMLLAAGSFIGLTFICVLAKKSKKPESEVTQ